MKSKAWHQRHKKDAFVKQANKQGYRARSFFKLEEIDKKDRLFLPKMLVLDVGAAPGSWSQYATEKIKPEQGGRVIAVDRLAIEPIDHVATIQGDILEPSTIKEVYEISNNQNVDLVICDIAPDITGISDRDQANMFELLMMVMDFSMPLLKKNGHMLLKVFEGELTNDVRARLKEYFDEVLVRKPKASRDKSKEFYYLAKKYQANFVKED